MKYEPGTILELQYGKVEPLITKETVRLEERPETYPTKKPYALARWRVSKLDRYGDYQDGFYRSIYEEGVPNEHYPEEMDYAQYFIKKDVPVETEEDALNEDGKPKRKRRTKAQIIADKIKERENPKPKGQRGRPKKGMTDAKARNIIRAYKKKAVEVSEDEVLEAAEFLEVKGEHKYLSKHFYGNS
jgi:hypothetical protein